MTPAAQGAPVYSKVIERYARAEESSVKLNFVVCVLSGVCAVLTIALFLVVIQPKPIHYIPGAVGVGVSLPGVVPLRSVGAFAAAWLMDRSNYTPETVEGAFDRAMRCMAPGFLSRSRAKFHDEIEQVRRDRMSSVFAMKKEPEVHDTREGFVVRIEGERGVYMGKEELVFEPVQVEFVITRVYASEANPFGLWINELKRTKANEQTL